MKLATILSAAARLVDGLLVLLVAVVLGCVAVTSLGPRLGHPALVIEGGSMQPAIPLGALVVLDGGLPADLRAGDIVSFQAGNGTIVTHRIVRLAVVAGTPFIATKGDANADPDPVLTAQTAILGRVIWTVPGAGYLARLLASPAGVLAAFLVGATLVVLALLLEQLAADQRHRIQRRSPSSSPSHSPTG